MKQETKKYTVTIFGESYSLVGNESEHDVTKAADQVDALMKEIDRKASHITSYEKAVLTALQLALCRISLESERENSKQVLKKLVDTIEYEMMPHS